MTSHILAPLKALAARFREATQPAPTPRPLELSFEVPPGMRGKPLTIHDADGNLVGVVGARRVSSDIARMIG